MQLGIDFGTNRVVVAAADRGNYPLVVFETGDGGSVDWFPSLVAIKGDERRYGWQAWSMQADHEWTVIRSVKRLLEKSGPHTLLDTGQGVVPVLALVEGLIAALARVLRESSSLSLKAGEPLQAMVGVPANANSNQRFLTVEAFRRAGFQVLGLLNEPAAASIEFANKQATSKSKPESILVYDLGGGTFDASLVTVENGVHHVAGSAGISSIGGDDFDHVLADLALESAGIPESTRDTLSPGEWFRLLDECRQKKESLNPNSRRITIDLDEIQAGWSTSTIAVSDFYESIRPLVDETIEVTEELAQQHGSLFDALYVTGGGSELPLVARALKEQFGRRVRRSAYTRSATAIGLAIHAEMEPQVRTIARLGRYFGVWREAEHGSKVIFDPLFGKGDTMPVRVQRSYSPAHNVGHFRFVECTHIADDGSPSGEVMIWDEIRFPFDAVHRDSDLQGVPVTRTTSPQHVEEEYECDATGSIAVTITNATAGYSRKFPLGRWTGSTLRQYARARELSER